MDPTPTSSMSASASPSMRFHSYVFFDAVPGAPMLAEAERTAQAQAFAECVAAHDEVRTIPYATLAMKAGSRFMLHLQAATPDAMQLLVRDLLHTPLGARLSIAHTLLGMTRTSQYNPNHPPKESAPEAPHRYLTVYPFTKTIAWHLLPYDERRAMMKAHVDVGRKFSSSISQLLLYSFGIDDQEFIVSYQMDSLAEFQTLVMELRGTEARRHTHSDVPIFTCIHMPILEALAMV